MTVKRVLLVDDEQEFTQTLVERLELRDIEAEAAASGHDALRKFRTTPFDIILLDVKMPGISGIETLQEIKRINPNQRVVLLTGHGSKEDAKYGMQLGAEAYLMKPVNLKVLLDIFQKAEKPDTESGHQ